MKRGDLVTVAIQGEFGKPQPALIIQADQFDALDTLTILPVSSTLIEVPLFRHGIEPSAKNGSRKPSQIMVDKPIMIRKDKIGTVVGQLETENMVAVERRLALFLGRAK